VTKGICWRRRSDRKLDACIEGTRADPVFVNILQEVEHLPFSTHPNMCK